MGKLIKNHPWMVGRWINPKPLEELEPRVFEAPIDPWEAGFVDSADRPWSFNAAEQSGADVISHLGVEGGPLTPEGQVILGEARSCVDCKHRMDPRPWWKRLLFSAKAEVFRCLSAVRDEVTNPVTGEINYTDNIFRTPSKGMKSPFGKCVDENLYGFCERFEDPS